MGFQSAAIGAVRRHRHAEATRQDTGNEGRDQLSEVRRVACSDDHRPWCLGDRDGFARPPWAAAGPDAQDLDYEWLGARSFRCTETLLKTRA